MPGFKEKKQEGTDNGKPRVAPKEPLLDNKTDYWNKRILEGPLEQRIAAIKEAVEKKDIKAIFALIEAHRIGDELDGTTGDALLSIVKDNASCPEITEFLPSLVREASDLWMTAYSCAAIKEIAMANKEHPEVKKAILQLIENLDNRTRVVEPITETLAQIGDSMATEPLRRTLKIWGDLNLSEEAKKGLKKLGIESHDKINKMLESHQQAAYKLITERKDVKKLVFENAKMLDILSDKQAWITINEPQLAMNVLKLTLEKLGDKRGGLENILSATLGVKIKQLEDAHFIYYADEILDIAAQVVRNSKLKDDKELSGLLSKIKYGDDVKLRYVKRERSDLTLGDRCGDCTATGSIHFGDSVMWFINPGYQILKMSKEGRFIGKINFTFGKFAGKDAIIIDALEFNPQAQEGKPYYTDGLKCFDAALEFLRDLAKREDRELFALRTSNSSGAVAILEGKGEYVEFGADRVQLALLMPNDDIRRTLANTGYTGEVGLFYQMLEATFAVRAEKDLIDERLPELERQVLNLAQISNSEIAAAMRERNFGRAALLILSDPELDKKVKKILGLPDVKLAPKFLSEKIGRIYRTESADIDSLKQTFNVDANDFIKL